MTDDFHLFADPDDGEHAVDADLALITAYLARELSPMQVLAVEERLITDAEFRNAVQPLIDAWAAPVGSLSGSAASTALSDEEKGESWRRFQHEASTGEQITPITRRRISMKRVAAVIGITVLPMVTFAQAVVYSANHESAPGHALAQRLVSIFEAPVAPPTVAPVVVAPIASAADEPVSRQLTAPPVATQKVKVLPIAPEEIVLEPGKPDRAKIIELTKQHQAAIVRGDTAVSYIVMVLDAAGKYQWSTFGNGNVMCEVAGDTRTAAERSADAQANRAELFGNNLAVGGGRGGGAGGFIGGAAGGGTGAVARGGGGGGGVATARARLVSDTAYVYSTDSGRTTYSGATIRAVRGDSVRLGGDSMRTATITPLRADNPLQDSLRTRMIAGRARGGGGSFATDSVFFGGGVRDTNIANARRTYRNGFVSTQYGSAMNQAPGLQDLSAGQSGIQGLPSSQVSAAETYLFGAGELAPTAMRVVVVHLVAGTTWRHTF